MSEDHDPPLHPETRAVTGGRADQHGALAPLLWPSTTFETTSAEEAARLAKSVDPDRFYSRHGNPGVRAFEEAVAGLEGAEAARAYASGMGAVTGVILGICSAGDHIVAQRQLYSQVTSVLLGICPRFGIDVTLVDGTEPGAFAAAVQPGKTTLVFAESPANPRLDLVDLDEVGAIKGPVTCVDSTFATPLGQQPLAHGVDLVLHSATKGIAGHNDASLGIVCGSRELIDWLWGFAIFQGANASPFDAMNGLRGLRTLGVRLARQSDTALALAEVLEGSPHVDCVRYPGLDSHPQRDLAKRQLYSQVTSVLLGICPRFGIDVTMVDGTEPGAFAAAVQPGKTTLVFAETPANPRLDLVDLDEIGAIKGPVTCVDSTFATPLGQQPLAHGCDLVLHSATKGIAGHNDASLGIVCGSQELIDWLWGFAIFQGANASPFDAMNGVRGLRTLGVRLARQSATGQELAERLEASPLVEAVRYPGLDSHPQRDLAKRQLAHTGSVLAFDVVGGRAAGQAFVEALQVARMATSLGGPETIVSHPASTTHQSLLPEELEAVGIGPGTIRLSVGLEHVDDIVADVLQALDAASKVS